MTEGPTGSAPLMRSGNLILGLFTASVFLSALLLFGVQPMFARMVLPKLGGSPSVWSVAMVFFQSMLLAGYAYAHVLTQLRRRWLAVAIHLVLLSGAIFALPLSIADGWGAPPASGTALWLLALFTASIGLPFFALSANNPLLQAWFVRTGHREGHDPYFLYAASNVGSFLALLSYPLLLEPVFTLSTQGWMWSAGFVLLVVLIASCAVVLLRSAPDAGPAHPLNAETPRLTWLVIGRWIFVSTVPAGLLIAVTAHISTELTSAPLFWVIPLSLYLLTWILVFQRRPLIPHELVMLLQPLAVAAIVLLLYLGNRISLPVSLGGHLFAFFTIAMACHGELARSRPAPAHLTAFYVSLAFGGMIGGLFAGLLAPYIFSWIAEYPILAVLAIFCRPFAPPRRDELWFWLAAAIVAAVLIAPTFVEGRIASAMLTHLDIAVIVLICLSIALMGDAPKSAAAVVLALVVMRAYPDKASHLETVRSFFGVNQIYQTSNFRVLEHGSTIHGAQQLVADDGKPPHGRPRPLTYYHDASGIAAAIDSMRARHATPLRVAVIGLGTGSLACRMAPKETWKFFEIDAAVIEIARDPRRFNFISTCAPDVPVVLGDARLTMAKETDNFYDLIIVDAYSSDAIPVHLTTREAMAIYKSKLARHGAIVMHISNRYLDLTGVVAGIAAANGLQTWLWNNPASGMDIAHYVYPSVVTVSAESADDVGTLARSERWTLTPPDPAIRTWTDNYANIIGAFWRKTQEHEPTQASGHAPPASNSAIEPAKNVRAGY